MENITMLDMKANDMLSKFNKEELEELRKNIKNSTLPYREHLGFGFTDTFGVEIEYENLSRNMVDRYIINNYRGYTSSSDETVPTGGEIDSHILVDKKEDWKELQQICLFLTENGVVTSENAGGHIHVGSHILENSLNYWRQFLKTYMLYEKELLEFFKGESSKMRLSSGRYAFPIAKILYQDLAALNDTLCFSDLYDEIFLKDRNVAVNFKNIKRSVYKPYPGSTIEFRSPNRTSKEIIWQNNINTAVKLFKAPVKGMIDEEYLDYRLREELPTESSYTNALELVDTIFDNNLDKIYFLKQYNKDFNFKEEKSRGLIKSKF